MKVLIAVPCHDYVHADFTRCLMELERPSGTGFAMLTGSLIYTARTVIANKAVEQGFDRVLWLDSDMTFKPDLLLELSADMDEGLDMVTGLYFTRKKPVQPVIMDELHWKVRDDGWVDTGFHVYEDYPQDSLFEIAGCGFGCCMTSAKLLRAMNKRHGSPFYPLMGMGEDTTFCIRARDAGYKIFCDSRVKCGHISQQEVTEESWRASR